MWEIARPSTPSRLPGLDMAGFADHGTVPEHLRLVPHPAVTMLLDFGPSPITVEENGRPRQGTLVAGLEPGDVRLASDSVHCVQVRMSPILAGSILAVPLSELEHGLVDLDDVWGAEVHRVRERLHEATTWEDRFEIVETLLLRRCHEQQRIADDESAWAWKRIVTGRGQVRVSDLATEIGWSRKRLWARFRAQVGVTPKRAANLVRFDHAAHRLAAGVSPAQVAAEGGYADQSHLNREVQRFTGATPAALAGAPWLAVDDIAWPGR